MSTPAPRTKERITWERLAELEPGIKELLADAEAERALESGWYCRRRTWNARYRARLMRLLGFWRDGGAEDECLRTWSAWQVAFWQIFRALPSCTRGCTCELWEEWSGYGTK